LKVGPTEDSLDLLMDHKWGRVVATLIRITGDWDLAVAVSMADGPAAGLALPTEKMPSEMPDSRSTLVPASWLRVRSGPGV
jgi:hypothetical protein